jgi:hypothetical protein
MSRINAWLLEHGIRIAQNPCISPDFCLDWPALCQRLEAGAPNRDWPDLIFHQASRFALPQGQVTLVEEPVSGDHCWWVVGGPVEGLSDGLNVAGQRWAYPASFANLIGLKNAVQAYEPNSCIFPVARGNLAHSSLGIGARFTSLHWPAVDWSMAQLGISLTANQNSIPRELVFDVDTMLDGQLDVCRFPFIGGDVPEGHQGQSVQGMSHGAVLAKLKHGFHRRGIPWGFNADHQPVGGKFDAREDQLVVGCLFSTYITFDLSPELLATEVPDDPARIAQRFQDQIPSELAEKVRARVAEVGVALDQAAFRELLVRVYPAMQKMLARDRKYAAARAQAFSTDIGRAYFRELSIDELPGLTTPATLASMLALAEVMDMSVQYVAPAFGFQKNFPFEDNTELERRVRAAWDVCQRFGVSIGFHSGSGKSAENYQLVGRICDRRLEIKTSGRYTYEMGKALAASSDAGDQALWRDWYAFTRELAVNSAFSSNDDEASMARSFIEHALRVAGQDPAVFDSAASCRTALEALSPDPDHMFWFEYNFLYVLAAGGSADKVALGDHSPAGYAQRARFYGISDAGRLAYAKQVARYICFLAEHTGLVSAASCQAAQQRLDGYSDYGQLLADIAG